MLSGALLNEAEQLMLAPATDVLELVRLRRLDGVPVCVDSSVVALSRAPGIADIDMTDRSLYATLREEAKVEIARSDYTVDAEIADDDAAGLLRLELGAAVLIGEEVGFSLDEQPVQPRPSPRPNSPPRSGTTWSCSPPMAPAT